VKAATGEEVTVEELGGGRYAYQHIGDRRLCGFVRTPCHRDRPGHCRTVSTAEKAGVDWIEPEPRHMIRKNSTALSPGIPGAVDMRRGDARMWTAAAFTNTAGYGQSLICGFARMHGYQIGILANNACCQRQLAKGAHFIQLCDKNRTPLLFLQNIHWLSCWTRVRAARYHKDGAN